MRDGGDTVARGADQAPPRQRADRALHGALRQAGRRHDVAVAGANRRPAAGRAIPEMQVDEERRRLPIVQDEIGHQRLEHVGVEPELLHGPL